MCDSFNLDHEVKKSLIHNNDPDKMTRNFKDKAGHSAHDNSFLRKTKNATTFSLKTWFDKRLMKKLRTFTI